MDYELLDDLALAAARGKLRKLPNAPLLRTDLIGPLVELEFLCRSGKNSLPRLAELPETLASKALRTALTKGSHLCGDSSSRVGFIRTLRDPTNIHDENWVMFCWKAQEAAEFAGIPRKIAQGLIGAIGELEDNIHLHSELSSSGLVGFRASPSGFEFIIADGGIGVLDSLRQCIEYASLSHAGAALRVAVGDGNSRFGKNSGHGFGFRDLFTGLSNRHGSLRFRSGNYALIIDGRNPQPEMARLAEKAPTVGLSILVHCHTSDWH